MTKNYSEIYYSLEDLSHLVSMEDYSSIYNKITNSCRWYIEVINRPLNIKTLSTKKIGSQIFDENKVLPSYAIYVSGILQLAVIPTVKEVSIYELKNKIEYGGKFGIFSDSEMEYYNTEAPKINSNFSDILKPIIEENEHVIYKTGILASTKNCTIAGHNTCINKEFYMSESLATYLSNSDAETNLINSDLLFFEKNDRYLHISRVDQSKLRFLGKEILKATRGILHKEDFEKIEKDLKKKCANIAPSEIEKGSTQIKREAKLKEYLIKKHAENDFPIKFNDAFPYDDTQIEAYRRLEKLEPNTFQKRENEPLKERQIKEFWKKQSLVLTKKESSNK